MTSLVCSKGRERKVLANQKMALTRILHQNSLVKVPYSRCCLAGLMQKITELTMALIYLIQASVLLTKIFLATGNWKHVFEAALPSRQPWHHKLRPSSALPSTSLSRPTLSRRPLWRIRCTVESLPLPYPVFNKAFWYDCSLVLALFPSRHIGSRGSPRRRDHCPVGTTEAVASSLGALTQRPGQGCEMQTASLWMTGNCIFDQKAFPNDQCIKAR